MPPVDGKNPKRAASSESQLALMEFMRDYPDDDACLEWLWRERYSEDGLHAHCPRCDRVTRFKRYDLDERKQAWTCTSCTKRLYPTAGTIFHKSSTSLHLWFFAIYLITSTRCGVSAKQLERELGVTYKTAWRMFNLIRNKLMVQDDEPLSGEVEVDETWIGGKLRESERRQLRAQGIVNKGPYTKKRELVFGAVKRGGQVRATTLAGSRALALQTKVAQYVVPGSMLYTDDWGGYEGMGKHYRHRRINHSARIYVQGDVHTQTIEGFFGLVKNGIRGVYHSVSAKWLQGYLNEYAWRYNHRDNPRAMFDLLLRRAAAPAD
jgi:transposase